MAVAQVGGILFNPAATLVKVEQYCREAASAGASIVVFPEALLGGYPKGESFGAVVGRRTPEGRALFGRYWEGAIDVPGPETAQVQALAGELSLSITIGVIERVGSTLCCTALVFQPSATLPHIHRKLMPTACERLIWGFGDGSTMRAVDTPAGRVGCAICWENYMPAFRLHMYGQGVELWCAPTVDDREMWRASIRHIAYEGRCFVLSACQFTDTISGGSLIVSPMGDVLAGPILTGEGLLTAQIDLAAIPEGKFDLDVTGHYARPDIFSLEVNTRPQTFIREKESAK